MCQLTFDEIKDEIQSVIDHIEPEDAHVLIPHELALDPGRMYWTAEEIIWLRQILTGIYGEAANYPHDPGSETVKLAEHPSGAWLFFLKDTDDGQLNYVIGSPDWESQHQ